MSCSYKNESGRSMVEMLGVLAIIGVLSVAGIAGYTSAMKQYRSNEIVNATSVLYILGQSQKQGKGDNMNYTSIASAPTGTSQIAYDNTTKVITITFTDTDLCPPVKNKLGDKAGECTAGSLTVNFEGTTTSEETSTPVVDLSGITSQVECEAAGEDYYWMFADASCDDGTKVRGDACYHSYTEAKNLCENIEHCIFDENYHYCGYAP